MVEKVTKAKKKERRKKYFYFIKKGFVICLRIKFFVIIKLKLQLKIFLFKGVLIYEKTKT
jgi:hypothetical protein